jgi:two-component SAPR family response regulator
VLVTPDPLEALDLVQRVRIDVLVDDVRLSSERLLLVERLRSVQPEVRLVRVVDPEDPCLPEIDGEVILRRPFSLDELERAVERALVRELSME